MCRLFGPPPFVLVTPVQAYLLRLLKGSLCSRQFFLPTLPFTSSHLLPDSPCSLLSPTSLSFPLIFPGLLWVHLVCDFDTTFCTILCAPSSILNCYLFCRWSHYTYYSIICGRFFSLQIQIFISLQTSCHFLKDRNYMDK